MTKEHQTGKRFQVIVLQVNRNKSGAITELLKLQEYFSKKNENYKLLGYFYGSPSNSLVKTTEFFLNNNHIAHPHKTLYEIIDEFIEHSKIKSLDVADIALWNDLVKVSKGLKIIAANIIGFGGNKNAVQDAQS